ncbi:MAG: hypothetical protein P8J91_14245 [Pirellulaceae bacterium]|nr:hypothetical protein [Pirellulaceae bacterium]MDG2104907.1 hypothetical protein [Pirellulaceae bacterium]
MIRLVLAALLFVTAVCASGCGTAAYDERFQQRGNELKSLDTYEK